MEMSVEFETTPSLPGELEMYFRSKFALNAVSPYLRDDPHGMLNGAG